MLFYNRIKILVFIPLVIFCYSCKNNTPPSVSFYYWKTTFAIDSTESYILKENKVEKIQVRYFDIGYDKQLHQAVPIGVIRMTDQRAASFIIEPVIYIKKEVFEKTNHLSTDSLAQKVYQLVQHLNKIAFQNPGSIQFDCDWTESTRDGYFEFLKTYKKLSGRHISATIRLHQIKYVSISGIPPVDNGVLMFYNMGKINAGDRNSIFDAPIAASYLDRLNAYPLKLSIALPIFSWGIQIRNGKVVHLLNKMDDRHFKNNVAFRETKPHRYKVLESCFKGGYYFLKDDEVKVETITPEDMKVMAKLITTHSKQPIQQITFYDLDAFNLKKYDTNIYEKTAAHFN